MNRNSRIIPKGNSVLIAPVRVAETTHKGIHLPEVAQEKPMEHVVLELGNGKNIEVRKGDRVLVERSWDREFRIGGRLCRIVKSDQILAVLS